MPRPCPPGEDWRNQWPHRGPGSEAWRGFGRRMAIRALFFFGFVLLMIVGLVVAPMVSGGYYEVESVGPGEILVHSLFSFAIGALIQELAFRLILFRLLEELTGTWLGLGLVEIAFSLAHSANPNATAVTLLALGAGEIPISFCAVAGVGEGDFTGESLDPRLKMDILCGPDQA